ncbi:hypothetical protein M0R04_14005 [Candidatus Dojkabacteria bacterium]|jgi:hypothetical protein|nr:hypothetical protein [Candidatus Dojkabacteria bacterium]
MEKQVYSEKGMKLINWLVGDDTGASSVSILIHMTGSKSMKNTPPSDKWDRGRCVRLLKIMPEWIDRLDEMNVYKGWKEQIILLKQDLLV